jgi:hypothetical protein
VGYRLKVADETPLFLKIFLGVCLSFIVVNLVWFADCFAKTQPQRGTYRPRGFAGGFRHTVGGENACASSSELGRLRPHNSPTAASNRRRPEQDPFHRMFSTTATDPQGQRYAITYRVSRFDGRNIHPLYSIWVRACCPHPLGIWCSVRP